MEALEPSAFLEKFRVDERYPCVTERYFKPQLTEDGHQCVLRHSNKLCVVAISNRHPILVEGKTVVSVDFECSNNRVNRLNNKVSGRFKRGGQKLKSTSPLCCVRCSDGSTFELFSCVGGTLVEVNERLVNEPNLLAERPWSDGYVAIVLPPFQRSRKNKNGCQVPTSESSKVVSSGTVNSSVQS